MIYTCISSTYIRVAEIVGFEIMNWFLGKKISLHIRWVNLEDEYTVDLQNFELWGPEVVWNHIYQKYTKYTKNISSMDMYLQRIVLEDQSETRQPAHCNLSTYMMREKGVKKEG